MQIITLAACHNRKSKTLLSLGSLVEQAEELGIATQHVVVDDGSLDGTATAIGERYPAVKVLSGDGTLYWAGAMRVGWEDIRARSYFDYLLVYNDDVEFSRDALATLLHVADNETHVLNAVVGTFTDPNSGTMTYGGQRRVSRWHPLKLALMPLSDSEGMNVATCNMNAVLIPRRTLCSVGFLSPEFIHRGADTEWGLRLTKLGGRLICTPKPIGTCERNQHQDRFVQHSTSLLDCYKRLNSVKKMPFKERYFLFKSYGGVAWPLLILLPYFSTFFKYFYYKFR